MERRATIPGYRSPIWGRGCLAERTEDRFIAHRAVSGAPLPASLFGGTLEIGRQQHRTAA